MYGIALIIILITMGGVIAYIGDKLGTKVGKKKLSIFGLRPKHTSILVTIITGILITSSTLGIMALSSQNVRVALFGMERLNRQIQETQTNLQEIAVQLTQANQEREATIAALTQAQGDYKMALQDLTQSKDQVAALENTKARLEQAKQELDGKVMALSDERTKLEGDIDRLNLLTQHLSEGIQFVREGEIVYRSGEVIVSMVLPTQESGEKLQEELVGVLTQANHNILQRLNIKKEMEALWLTQGELEQALQQLRQSRADMIVRVVAAGNIVYGEPVRAHIELFSNEKIYEEGQLIYSQNFTFTDPNESEQVIIAFLKAVNMAATERGIIPDPLQGSVGIMNGAQFYDIVHRIGTAPGEVRLTAYAEDDTSAIGPLRLKIKVEHVQ